MSFLPFLVRLCFNVLFRLETDCDSGPKCRSWSLTSRAFCPATIHRGRSRWGASQRLIVLSLCEAASSSSPPLSKALYHYTLRCSPGFVEPSAPIQRLNCAGQRSPTGDELEGGEAWCRSILHSAEEPGVLLLQLFVFVGLHPEDSVIKQQWDHCGDTGRSRVWVPAELGVYLPIDRSEGAFTSVESATFFKKCAKLWRTTNFKMWHSLIFEMIKRCIFTHFGDWLELNWL